MRRTYFIYCLIAAIALLLFGCKPEPIPMQHYYHDGLLVEGIEVAWYHRNGNCDDDADVVQSFVNPFQFQGGKYTVMGCSWDSEPAYGIRCFDTETGKIKWEARLLQNVSPSSPQTGDYYRFRVVKNNDDYAYFARRKFSFTDFWKVDLSNGNIVWCVEDSVEWNQGNYAIRMVDDDYLYYSKCKEADGHVANIWRMRTSDGVSEQFYSEPAVPPYNQYKMYTAPFVYNGKQYHFLYKQDLIGGTEGNMRFNYKLMLLDGSTKQVLWTWNDPSHHHRSENIIDEVDVYNGNVILFFEKSCSVFDMEQMQFAREIQILPPLDTNAYEKERPRYEMEYIDHIFYKDYMIVRTDMWTDNPVENYPPSSWGYKPRSFQIIDVNTGRFVDQIPQSYYGSDGGYYADYAGHPFMGHLQEVDGIIYYSNDGHIQAYDLNQLKRLMAINHASREGFASPCYKTSKGDVHFLVEGAHGNGGVYCFKSPFSNHKR